MDLGERIRYVRRLKGMTQLELAEKCGLGSDDNARTRISQYENGSRTPKEHMLKKISKALGVKSLYLSTEERTPAYDLCMLLFDIDNDGTGVKIVEDGDKHFLQFVYYEFLFEDMYKEWIQKKKELEDGKITKDEYIMWKINYGSKDN